jgi:hypothetical protein
LLHIQVGDGKLRGILDRLQKLENGKMRNAEFETLKTFGFNKGQGPIAGKIIQEILQK